MSSWIKSEEGNLLNLDEVSSIHIDEIGFRKKRYQVVADNNLVKKFSSLEEAQKFMIKLEAVVGITPYSKEIMGEQK